MANTHKTKAEMLQELESIKGLLLEEEDIPILQPADYADLQPPTTSPVMRPHASVLPGQGSLFDDPGSLKPATTNSIPPINVQPNKAVAPAMANRIPTKPSGENPFLPEHIRQRLHGNNPPPLFEYETARKIATSTQQFQSTPKISRHQLVNDVINSLMPDIETELRHRLFAMSTEDLEQLLMNDDD